jgi:hypothetical protein
MRLLITFIILFLFQASAKPQDTSVTFEGKVYQLDEVIVRRYFEYAKFLKLIKNDTTFYKAFRNLKILNYTSYNDIKLYDKKRNVKASLLSKTNQIRKNGCRKTEVVEEKTTGDFYDKNHNYNYFTAELYASLFFAPTLRCGETNIVAGTEISAKGKKGIDKHKEQLKMLFFNPGKKIQGIPFMGDKVNIFDPESAQIYDFKLERNDYRGKPAFIFSARPKENANKNKIVIDSMTTWFDAKTLSILARTYTLSYKAGVYDFNVTMEVEMEQFQNMLVPKVLRYIGDWDVITKKRERAVFTATLFNFKKETP